MLYERFAAVLFGVCRRYGRDTFEAEDMHQIGFVRIFDQIGKFRGSTRQELEAWLRRVMVTTCLNALASQKRHKVWLNQIPDDHPEQPAPGEPRLDHLDAEELQGMVNALPDGARTIFNLFAVEGYAHAEIAQMLGISEGASRAQLTRARHILKQKLHTIHQQQP